jgi:hypothetical protein
MYLRMMKRIMYFPQNITYQPYTSSLPPSIYYAVPTEIGSENFVGLIFNNSNTNSNSIILNYEKPLYYIPSMTVIQNATLRGFYSLKYENTGSGSILKGQRTTYKYIPYNGYVYNIVVIVNVELECIKPITDTTTIDDINGNIIGVKIINKSGLDIGVYTPGTRSKYNKYSKVTMKESYSPDNKWNYILTDFSNAEIIGSSNNIYPTYLKAT